MENIKKIVFLTELNKMLGFMDEADKKQTIMLYDGMFEEAFDEEQLCNMLISPTRQAVYLARSYNNRQTSMDMQIRSRYVETSGTDQSLPSYIRAINRIYDDAEKRGIISPDNLDIHKYDDPEPEEIPQSIAELIGENEEPTVEEIAEAVDSPAAAEKTSIPEEPENEEKTIEGILSGIAATMAALVGKGASDEDEEEPETEVEEIPAVKETTEEAPVVEEAPEVAEEIPAVEEAPAVVEDIPVVEEAPVVVEDIPVVEEAPVVVEEPVAEIEPIAVNISEEELALDELSIEALLNEQDGTDNLFGQSLPSIEDIMAELLEKDAPEQEDDNPFIAPAAAAAVAAGTAAVVAAASNKDEDFPDLSVDPQTKNLISQVTADSSVDDMLAALTSGASVDSVLADLTADKSLDDLLKELSGDEPDLSAAMPSLGSIEGLSSTDDKEVDSDPFVLPEAEKESQEDFLASLIETKKPNPDLEADEDENYDNFDDLQPKARGSVSRRLDPAVAALLEGKSLKEARALAEDKSEGVKAKNPASGEDKSKLSVAKTILFAIPAILVSVLLLALLIIPLVFCGGGAALAVALGIFCFGAAFGGAFTIIADILIVLGAAVVLFALGLLLAWCFIWLLFGVVPSYFKSVAALCRRLCSKKGA